METEELVRRCKDGDRGALALLYQTYSGRLFRLCADIVKDKDAARDLLHDGFIIIFSSIGSLRSPARLEAWMSRVMTNLAVKYLNDRKNLPVAGAVADVPVEAEEGQGGCDIPFDELMRMIDMLPEGYRNVFRLSVLEGLSHDEIARMLGFRPRTSSSQLLRARVSLQKMITAYRARLVLLLAAVAVSVVTLLLRQPSDGQPELTWRLSAQPVTQPVAAAQTPWQICMPHRRQTEMSCGGSMPKTLLAQGFVWLVLPTPCVLMPLPKVLTPCAALPAADLP